MKTARFNTYEPALQRAITAAVAKICAEIERSMPLAAPQLNGWLTSLSGTAQPADYYLQRAGSPMFLFPWFLEKTLHPQPNLAFQSDLIYSTINGYYVIRMIDNLTDQHATTELQLLPALGFFHSRFQLPYQRHFPADHPFWDYFTAVWSHSADVTIKDLRLDTIDRDRFIHISAQKPCALKIPLAAVCHIYQQPELIAPWSRFVDLFGCWQQMLNDVFHWHEDLSLGTATYFLSEAHQRKHAQESISAWVIRDGFAWGLTVIDAWMAEAQALARDLGSADLLSYLHFRQARLERERKKTLAALQLAAKLEGFIQLT